MKSHRSFTIICLRKTLIAPSVYELRCEKPTGFSFKPGQFILFDVPLLEDAQDIQPRAYSIASAPSEPDLLFIMKLIPNGRASRWIERSLDVGSSIRMQGPFGAFTLDTDTTKPYLFAATGTGIAPLRSQLFWALEERNDGRLMRLIFGVLRKEDLFWEATWKQWEHKYPNFHVHISFLSGDADWHDAKGSVQERVRSVLTDPSHVSIYICGATETVKEVKTLCLTLGVPKQDMHTESYL